MLPSKLLSIPGAIALLGGPLLGAQVTWQSSSAPARAASVPFPVETGRAPNVLVILCDQLNVRMLGHEDNGYGGVRTSLTPSLDLLAQQGVRFTNAACPSAVCQASRYSILTGRWPYHHGVRVNSIWEPRGETVFPELAQAVGYRTAYIGLHHLMWFNQPEGWGDDHGFDEVVGMNDYLAYCAANGVKNYSAPTNIQTIPNLPAHGGFELTGFTFSSNRFHPSGYWADQVIDFLRERAGPSGDGQPFVCWYSMISPHTPVLPSGVPPDDWAHLYHPFEQLALPPNLAKVSTTERLSIGQSHFSTVTDGQWREALSYYYGLISQLDSNIGRVLQELEALELAQDTLVVFTTDHGEMASQMRCWTKGMGSYDALTRVPLILRLPGVLPAGRTVSAPASSIDIFPTLVEVTGVPIADEVRAAVDGVSLLDVMLQSTTPPGWRQETFHALGSNVIFSQHHFMARTPSAKYTSDELDGAEEFYDLLGDPFEIINLINDPSPGIQAQIADLRARRAQWWNNQLGHAPHYALIGAWSAVPAPSSTPVPMDGAVGVARDADPSWLPCSGAAIQEVYFGTSAASLGLYTTLQHMETAFNPGTLEPGATYYWRVAQINANGGAAGPLWSFTTESGGSGGPGLAASPVPPHRASKVPLGSSLAWTVAPGTLSQKIHFGRAGDLQPVGPGVPASTSNWDPGVLLAGVSYEWRIDGIDPNGTTEGDLWTFEVSPAGLPKRALPLSPRHLVSGIPSGASLAWTPGEGALSHAVYFGSSFPLALRGNQTGTTWSPGLLVPGQAYYWRIDEVNSFGTRTGWTWRFSR